MLIIINIVETTENAIWMFICEWTRI